MTKAERIEHAKKEQRRFTQWQKERREREREKRAEYERAAKIIALVLFLEHNRAGKGCIN